MKKSVLAIIITLGFLTLFANENGNIADKLARIEPLQGRERLIEYLLCGIDLLNENRFEDTKQLMEKMRDEIDENTETNIINQYNHILGESYLNLLEQEKAFEHYLMCYNYGLENNHQVDVYYFPLITAGIVAEKEEVQKIIEHARKNKNEQKFNELMSKAYYEAAKHFSFKNKWNKTVHNVLLSLELSHTKERIDYLNKTDLLIKAYTFMNDLENALLYLMQSLQISHEEDYLQRKKIYRKLYKVYKKMGDYDKALEYILKAEETLNHYDFSPNDKSKIIIDIGLVYKNMGRNEKAIFYLEKALSYNQKNNLPDAAVKNNLAIVLKNIGQYQRAIDLFTEVIDIYKVNLKVYNYSAGLINRAIAYYDTEEYDKAMTDIKESLKIGEMIDNDEVILESYRILVKLNASQNKYKEAYENMQKLMQLELDFKERIANKNLLELRTRFETNQLQNENKLLKRENEHERLEKDLMRKIIILAVVAGILFIILSVILYGKFTRKVKDNKALLEKNVVISKQKEELQKIYDKLEESEHKFRRLFHDSKDASFILKNGLIKDCNPAAQELLSDNDESIIDTYFIDYSADIQENKLSKEQLIKSQYKIIKEKSHTNFEWIILDKHKQKVYLDIAMNKIEIDKESYCYLVCRDITKQKELEQEKDAIKNDLISYSRKMSLGEITSGIAHEINQPLTFIKSMVQNSLLEIESGETDNISDFLIPVDDQVNRISRIINQLRSFGDVDEQDFIIVNFANVLKNTLVLLEKNLQFEHIEIINEITYELPKLKLLPQQFEQLLINLFHNSIEALKNVKNKQIKIYAESDRFNFRLIFADNGIGINKENLTKVFYPFFSTKKSSNKTHKVGLGLPIAKSIVEKHGGTITIDSVENEGTEIQIIIPLLKL